jgi:hypothetical protein
MTSFTVSTLNFGNFCAAGQAKTPDVSRENTMRGGI